MVIPVVRPRVTASARNRVPGPMGPGESFSARSMRGLYRGSLRSSATKSNTSSTGRLMRISPLMCAMAGLLVSARRRLCSAQHPGDADYPPLDGGPVAPISLGQPLGDDPLGELELAAVQSAAVPGAEEHPMVPGAEGAADGGDAVGLGRLVLGGRL